MENYEKFMVQLLNIIELVFAIMKMTLSASGGSMKLHVFLYGGCIAFVVVFL